MKFLLKYVSQNLPFHPPEHPLAQYAPKRHQPPFLQGGSAGPGLRLRGEPNEI